MADQVLLILRLNATGQPIAGALNLIGGDALYGRYWGAVEEVPFLHFELCYYQAIDAAIARGLGRVEAGGGTSRRAAMRRSLPGRPIIFPIRAFAVPSPTISSASAKRWRMSRNVSAS